VTDTHIYTVSVIIVDYCKARAVCEALEYLFNCQPVTYKLSVYVVDNSCQSTNADILNNKIDLERIHLKISDANVGYTKACNGAAALSNSDYILFLNPDIEFRLTDSLQKMVDHMNEHPQVAILGPKQTNPDGSIADTVRNYPTIWELLSRLLSRRLSFLAPKAKTGVSALEEGEEFWLQSSCILVRRDFWALCGGFDEAYYLFMSDIDLCRKALDLGYDVRYCEDVVVWADGKRASEGSLWGVLLNTALRAHIRDAVKYFGKQAFRIFL